LNKKFVYQVGNKKKIYLCFRSAPYVHLSYVRHWWIHD